MTVPTGDERADLVADAAAQFIADLRELERVGADHRFAEWLSAQPDPDTDDVEHD